MFTFLTVVFFTIWFSFLPNGSSLKNEIVFDARAGENHKRINILGNSSNTIIVSNVPPSITAILFEVHSHDHKITLSETEETCLHCSITGRNVGLVYKLHSWESEAHMWLINKMKNQLSVLIIITAYDSSVPVPGGCNMEFITEIAPYLRLRSNTGKNYLEFQHASMGAFRDEPPPLCSLSLSYITYDVFVSYLKENDFGEDEYFEKIWKMSDVSSVKKIANKIASYTLHPDTRFSFLMYPNVGVIYNVIAKYTVNGNIKETLYVPISSYGCGESEFTEHGCNFSFTVEGKLFLFLLSMYGFITAYFGHAFYGSTMFFFGFLAAFFIALILLGRFSNFSKSKIIKLSALIAILGGLMWYLLWVWLHNSVISLLLVGFVFGFLLAAVILFSPVGNSEINMNDKNYWLLLTTGSLFVTVLLLAYPNVLCILGSSVVGSYVMLLFYDDFIGTRLAYIILNIVKRAVSENLEFATNDLPFEIKDALMFTTWGVLSLFAIIVQSRRVNASNNINVCCCKSRRSNPCVTYSAECDPQQPLCNANNSVFYNTFPR